MNVQSGQILMALLLAVAFASSAAWIVALLYRRRMVALMRAATIPGVTQSSITQTVVEPAPMARRAPSLNLEQNRSAVRHLLVTLTFLCALIAATQAVLSLQFQFHHLSVNLWLLFWIMYAWPAVLAWGLALRWPWRRTLAGIAIYMVLMVAFAMWRSTEQQSTRTVMLWIAMEVGWPLGVTLLISASGRIRAVAPYLLPPALLLMSASIVALEFLSTDVNGEQTYSRILVNWFGAWGALSVAVLLPWVLLAWPVFALGRVMAAAYRAKRFSDLGYLFAVYWAVVLMSDAVAAFAGVGAIGFAVLLSWLWIPLLWPLLSRYRMRIDDPPSLLVLRVFQRDAEVESLFDQVVERWRYTGNTMLIAGSDLISRTLDPDDLFTFLSGHLRERFIDAPHDVARRLAAFDLAPDPDGRYRVNECYCRDATWELALAALVERCDVVLMDLRGFQPRNAGCRHELGVLSIAANVRRVVALYDAATDRQTAQADIGAAPTGRFVWLDGGRMDVAKAREVLASLFACSLPQASVPIEGVPA